MAAMGFVLSSEQFPAIRLINLGVAAERAGFDMVWMSDHFHPWMDNQGHSSQAWMVLAALLAAHQRLSLESGRIRLCLTHVHPRNRLRVPALRGRWSAHRHALSRRPPMLR